MHRASVAAGRATDRPGATAVADAAARRGDGDAEARASEPGDRRTAPCHRVYPGMGRPAYRSPNTTKRSTFTPSGADYE